MNSTRGSGLTESLIINFSHNPINTLGFFIPRFLVDENGLFKESASFIYGSYKSLPWAISIYLGVSLIFILPAVYFAQIRNTIFFTLIFLIFLILSFGGFIPGYGEVISNLPILNLSRYPEKYLYCVSGILVFGVAFGMESIFKNRNKANFLYIFLLVVILVDLYFVNLNQIPTINYKEFIENPTTLSSIKNGDKLTRIYSNELRDFKNVSSDKDMLEVKKSLLMHGIANQYGLANLNSPASLNLSTHEELISKIGKLSKQEIIAFHQNLSVDYITSQNKLTNYPDLAKEFYDDKRGVYLYKVKNSKPRVYTVNENANVEILDYKANRVKLVVELIDSDTLILSDTFYPGWNVLVNGSKAEIYKSNGLRAVKINRGVNLIEFNFFPKSLLLGITVSLISLVSLMLITIFKT